jgi:short chain dehydrogenase
MADQSHTRCTASSSHRSRRTDRRRACASTRVQKRDAWCMIAVNNRTLAVPGRPRVWRREQLQIGEWDRMLDVNIKGVLYGIAAALPYMKEQKAGHFINVSSVPGHKVGPGFAVYAATKHAVRALSEGLRARSSLAFFRGAVGALPVLLLRAGSFPTTIFSRSWSSRIISLQLERTLQCHGRG